MPMSSGCCGPSQALPGPPWGTEPGTPPLCSDTLRGNAHLPKRPPTFLPYTSVKVSVCLSKTHPPPTDREDAAPQSSPAGAAPATDGLHLGQSSGPCGLEHPTGPSPPSAHPPGTDTAQIIHFKTQGDPVPKAGGSQILLALCSDGHPLSFSLECGTERECPPAMLSTETGCTGPARVLGKIRENSLTSDFSSALSKSLIPVHFHNLDTMRSAFPVHNSSTDRRAHTPASLLRKALQKPPRIPCLGSAARPRAPSPSFAGTRPPQLEPPIRVESPRALTHRTHLAGSLHLKMKTSFRTSYNHEVQTKQRF